MVISVSKKELFDEVEKRSSLEGAAMPERFEGVWASAEEGKFLDSYWVEGCTAVIQLMKRSLSGQTVTHDLSSYDKDEVLSINATMPERYNSLLDGNVATDVKMLIACNILSGWLGVKAPEAAAKYEEEAKGYTEDLRVKLLYRNEPTNKVVVADNDSSSLGMKGEALAAADSDGVKVAECEMALAKGDADGVKVVESEMALAKGDADQEALKEGEGEDVYAMRLMENERNIYPAKEYLTEKCRCCEIPMKQERTWN